LGPPRQLEHRAPLLVEVEYLGAGVGGEDAHLEPDAPGRAEERLRGVQEPASAHEAEPLERLSTPAKGNPMRPQALPLSTKLRSSPSSTSDTGRSEACPS